MSECAHPYVPGIYDPHTETGKFRIGEETVVCRGALEFSFLIERYMGAEAADYFRELVADLIIKAGEGEPDCE